MLQVSLKQWKHFTSLINNRSPLLTCTDKDIFLVEKIFRSNYESCIRRQASKVALNNP
jgi:hypothetical protein